MIKAKIKLVVAFSLVSISPACSETATYPLQCGLRLPGWKKPSDGIGELAIDNTVKLNRYGRVTWNGEQLTENKLTEYLESATGLNPRPFTILVIENGASCDRVVRLRATVDQHASCNRDGLSACGEGPKPWARIGDVPPFPTYYPEHGNSDTS